MLLTDLTLQRGEIHPTRPIIQRVEQLKSDISREITAKGLRASGRTQQSITVTAIDNNVTLWGREFFATLERGSAPWSGRTGRRCSAEAFRGIIAQWIKDKGLIVDNIKSASFLIARSIMQKGTYTYRHRREDIYTPAIEQATKDINEIVTQFYNAKVNESLTEKYK